jgi:phytoene synthase
MGRVYRGVLDLLADRGFTAPRKPVRVSTAAKLGILLRYAFI